MKKVPTKRYGSGSIKEQELKKPFGFCCDIKYQDPETRYNMRIPPFKSSLTDVILNGGGPDLKFRIQEIGRSLYPIPRGGTFRPKGTAFLGDCKRCRKPLQWYLEEEIAIARNIVANDKQMKYNIDADRNTQIGIRKVMKRRRERRKRRKLKRKEDERLEK